MISRSKRRQPPTRFFISNTLISNARLKFSKYQAKAKQHLEAEPLLFENYSLSSTKLSSKKSRKYSKKYTKTGASVLMRLSMTMKMRLKIKKRSHIYNINGTRPRHGTNILNIKYKMYNDGSMY